jgi:hypothetical protein
MSTRIGPLEASARAYAREMGLAGTRTAKYLIASSAGIDNLTNTIARIKKSRRWGAEVEAVRREALTPKRDRPACGARTRRGGACQARAVWDRLANAPRNGRCRLHGGLTPRDDAKHEQRQARKRSRVSEAIRPADELSPQAAAAFEMYRSLPAPRSLRAVARAFAVRLPTIDRWALEGAWAERVSPAKPRGSRGTRRDQIDDSKGTQQ